MYFLFGSISINCFTSLFLSFFFSFVTNRSLIPTFTLFSNQIIRYCCPDSKSKKKSHKKTKLFKLCFFFLWRYYIQRLRSDENLTNKKIILNTFLCINVIVAHTLPIIRETYTSVQSGCRSDTEHNAATLKVSWCVWHVFFSLFFFTWDQQECTNEVLLWLFLLLSATSVRVRSLYDETNKLSTEKENEVECNHVCFVHSMFHTDFLCIYRRCIQYSLSLSLSSLVKFKVLSSLYLLLRSWQLVYK